MSINLVVQLRDRLHVRISYSQYMLKFIRQNNEVEYAAIEHQESIEIQKSSPLHIQKNTYAEVGNDESPSRAHSSQKVVDHFRQRRIAKGGQAALGQL